MWHFVTVTDAESCTQIDSVELQENLGPQFFAKAFSSSCDNKDVGIILIENIDGISDFEYTLDGVSFKSISTIPFLIESVIPGFYNLTIRDKNGCTSSETVEVPETEDLIIEFGESRKIKKGESIMLTFQTNANAFSYEWSPSESLNCTNCPNPIAFPTISTSYQVKITDILGCEAIGSINVFVEQERNIFIPNAFSPNGDNQNDLFIIEAGTDVVNIDLLQIFDRWGTLVFEAKDFQPGNPSFGWNGQFNGESLQQGVYVYRLIATFDDGKVEPFSGDVSLLR
jgi:gliding motility-associated-like protein